jgi:beta-glucanase (GH16 family)
MGTNCREVGWPTCGELDIAELVSDYTNFHSTLHGPQSGNPGGYEIVVWDPNKLDVTQNFHTYWADRRPNYIQVGIDNIALGTFTPDLLPASSQWVFEAPMYATFGLAVGNKYIGAPDTTTPSPSTMLIDWFRYTP